MTAQPSKTQAFSSHNHNTGERIDNRLWSNTVKHLTPYVPGEQPQHPNLCKLNTNENPFAPSNAVQRAMIQALQQQAKILSKYPDPESTALRQTMADYYGLQLNQVFVGNGSDEVLAHVFAAFFVKERPLLYPDISYSFYPVYADLFGIQAIKIPLRDDFSIHPDDYRQPCGGIIFANPNAPTGLLVSLTDIEKLLTEHPNAVIVVDEAYIDFADTTDGSPASAISLLSRYDNLLITQTTSKSRALAGLRVGMAFANPSLIEALNRVKNSFNSYPLDQLAQAGAKASFADDTYFTQTCTHIKTLRTELSNKLTELGFHVLPSQANFVFASHPNYHAADIATKLRDEGVIVRYFNQPRINNYLRITVGTAAQQQQLYTYLEQIITP